MSADSALTTKRDEIAFWPLGGSGPPALLLHGFGADHLSWLANQNAIGTVATVSALDLPGHGDSPMDVGDGAVATLAQRVAAVFDHKGLSKALRSLGHGDEAARITRERIGLVEHDPGELYQAACELALCMPLVRDESRKQALAGERVVPIQRRLRS